MKKVKWFCIGFCMCPLVLSFIKEFLEHWVTAQELDLKRRAMGG